MKTLVRSMAMILALALPAAVAFAQSDSAQGNGSQHQQDGGNAYGFVDADGDGFNDLAPDHDGDGIPNGIDPDWVKPEGGEGDTNRYAYQYGEMLRLFFGGEDVVPPESSFGFGPPDGSGDGIGLSDGSGFGPNDDSGDMNGTETVEDRRQGRR